MFGHRSDGKKVKDITPVFRILPCIMPERSDSQVYFEENIPIKKMEEYIAKKKEEGINLAYMDIVFTACARTISERPRLNRFIMNGRTYQRDKIYLSIVIKKSLSDDGVETPIKVELDGNETIFEVKEKLNKLIEENKKVETSNSTDKFVKAFNLIPSGILFAIVKFLRFLDKHGMLPKSLIALSPFHTSAFITNVGSIGIDSIYHHIYNFGTTSMFISMGRKKKSYIYEEDIIKEEKCITIRFVGDERICDGYYYATSFKQLFKYMKKPELLEKRPLEIKENLEEA